ncbi:MAG: hypothetical protein RMY34_04700 [Aulosira sp. DedQUE10]|nr:hypothetical protein [Aulosira sp. DedQUE10]
MPSLYHLIKNHEAYRALPTKVSKQICKVLFKRGLYRSQDGRFINADVNGSLNIGRKVIPDFMKGIEALPFVPVVVDPLRMHLSTSVKQWLDMGRFV